MSDSEELNDDPQHTVVMCQEPLYSCCNCADEYSWTAQDLKVYKNELWCDMCWDCREYPLPIDVFWSELESFVPDHDKKIAELSEELESAKKALISAWADAFWRAAPPTTLTRADAVKKAELKYTREVEST